MVLLLFIAILGFVAGRSFKVIILMPLSAFAIVLEILFGAVMLSVFFAVVALQIGYLLGAFSLSLFNRGEPGSLRAASGSSRMAA